MKLTIISTGGTISKTYDETDGSLRNVGSVLDDVLNDLRLPDLCIVQKSLFNKDSLDITEEERRLILSAVRLALEDSDAVIVVHGTDTLTRTGDLLNEDLRDLKVPVILTGAMRPYEFRDTDALQNVTESLLGARLLAPGVYVVMHNRVLRFPGVMKDRRTLTFRSSNEG